MGDSSRRSRSRSPRRERHKDKDRRERSERDDHRDRDHRDRRHGEREETEEERRERKRVKREREERRGEEKRERRGKDRRGGGGVRVVDDDEAGGMWVEKGLDTVNSVGSIPTAESLPLKSTSVAHGEREPPRLATEATGREAWMLAPGEGAGLAATVPGDERGLPRSAGGGGGEDELFASLGREHKRKDPNEDKPDPAKVVHSKYEMNTQLLEGKSVDEYKTEEKKSIVPGGPGYQWRMMKLRRLYEQAEEQSRTVEEVALERYGSLDEYHEALEERRIIDEREAKRRNRRAGGSDTGNSSSSGMRTPDATRRFVFNDAESSRPSSRQGFRRPGEEPSGGFHTPGGAGRVDALKRQQSSGAPRTGGTPAAATPIPSVFTPQALTRGPSAGEVSRATMAEDGQGPIMSIEQLNRLQAKVLRAKLTDDPDAEALEEQYDRERGRFDDAGAAGAGVAGMVHEDDKGRTVRTEVLPTLDGHGKLYDVGGGKEDAEVLPGNRRRKKEAKFETRDRQGNLLRYNADDDEVTLGELVRQEKFGGGASDMKNLDAELASQITRDARFDDTHDYMDDNADKLARKRMKTDAQKRMFAINDYKRTQKALDTCPFCYQDDRNPLTAVVALGKRTYLSCTLTEELVPGHCLIVPIQHCLSSLEMDDEDWDEVRNFMKCLMKMFAAENKGVVFYETILSFRQQRHTYIECVPLPPNEFADAPAYFRESILASESEWTQHKKLIDFSTRPGGFRRMLVPNMPYFMVQWDYKGEKGYGHIIEGMDDAAGTGDADELGGMDEGDKGGGRFPPYFAGEVIGSVLDLEPRKWLRPAKIDHSMNSERARALGTKFQPYNWTVQME